MKYIKILIGLLFTVVLHFAILKSGFSEYVDYKIYDFLSNVTTQNSEKNGSSSVVVVDIDEKSLQYLGQWPWSRVVLAQMMSVINQSHPSSIAFDTIFAESDRTSPKELINFYAKYLSTNLKIGGLNEALLDNDKLFVNELAKAKSILPVYMNNQFTGKTKCIFPSNSFLPSNSIDISFQSQYMLCNLEVLQKRASNIGFINSTIDKDGIFRRLPLFIKFEDKLIPTLGLASLMSIDTITIDKNKISILNHSFKFDKKSNVLLNFYDKSWYKTVSAIDVLSGNIDEKVLKGKFVFIGTTATGLHDNYMISSGEIISGVFSHATLVDNILNDALIYQPEFMNTVNIALSIVFSSIFLFFLFKLEYLKLFIIFTFPIVGYSLLSYYFLMNNIYLSLGYFILPFLLQFFIVNLISIFLHYRDKRRYYIDLTLVHSSTIDSMTSIIEMRDNETGAHITRTKEYIKYLSHYLYSHNIYKDILTPRFRELLYIANPLHDIGKVGIPDYVLKKPGKLTQEEFTIIKDHAYIGKKIIDNAMKSNKKNEFLKIAHNIAYCHHEKWDGSGYPQGLVGDKIPLEARIMALADVYDALVSRRCYKSSFEYSQAEQIIIEGKGTHFDPILIDVFIEIKDKFKEIAERIKD